MRRRSFIASLLALPGSGSRVYLQNVTETEATVCWDASLFGAAGVECDGRYFAAGVPGRARITGLAAGTEYLYRVGPVEASFRTAGVGVTPFLVIGDTGTGSAEQSALAGRLVRERAAFLLHTGDVAYPTGQAEAYRERYVDYYHSLMARTPFFPCPGNHDYYETDAEPYFAFHDLPGAGVPAAESGRYYSLDWGDATMVSIDSNAPLEDPARRAVMLDWLDRVLGTSTRFWRVVFFHHPPMAAGPNEGDVLTELARRHLVPVLERHRVPLVFNGHEHSYQRSVPVGPGEATYFTTGGGGAPLYPVGASPMVARGVTANHYLRCAVNGYRLDVAAVGLDGLAFDSVTLRPRPMVRAVVNGASFGARIGRGSPVSVFGWQLGLPGSREVSVRGLEVLAVTPGQINALLPAGLVGRVRLEVSTPNGRAETEIEVVPVAPALFAGSGVRSGGVLRVYATGMDGYGGTVGARVNGVEIGCRLLAGPVAGVQIVELPAVEGELVIFAGGERSNAITV